MAQAKRSPILGYNHNVRYRGVIFHVQTEDSGQLNPHLFTHLFHEGVIVSTRKLVYDAGSNEEAIKSLMQAQHKAVMKDLKKGTFDDKIDAYLGHVAGLEPREGGAPAPVAAADPEPPAARYERASTEHSPPPEDAVPESSNDGIPQVGRFEVSALGDEDHSEPIELPIKGSRVQTSDRTRPISIEPQRNAEPSEEDMAAAIAAANATAQQAAQQQPPVKSRTSTAQRGSRSSGGATPPAGTPRPTPPAQPPVAQRAASPGRPSMQREETPVLEIDIDEASGRNRMPRDTAVEAMPEQPYANRPSTPPPHGAKPAVTQQRASMSAPIVTRPVQGERKRPGDSEAVEIYQAPPPSVEPPPGERTERPGQYTMSRKTGAVPIREKTGRIAAINPASLGLSDTGSSRTVPPTRDSGSMRTPTSSSGVPTRPGTPSPAPPAVQPRTLTPQPGNQPPRAHVTAPITNRTATPAAGSGVVMSRPAVIVGAPPKAPVNPTQQRVRKAREDEGRGFGQGLISEKSLDEVILAYLSEDAEEK